MLRLPAAVLISQVVESFCDVIAQSYEQHVEQRESRLRRDSRDTQTVFPWLVDHSSFEYDGNCLISLSTGIVADETINCDYAVDCGLKAMKTWQEKHLLMQFLQCNIK